MQETRQRQRGVALVATGLAMIVIVPMVGLGIDVGMLYLVRARLSQAADAGSLAGARSLSSGVDLSSQAASASATATKYFYANSPAGFWGTQNTSVAATVSQNDATHTRLVSITAGTDAPLYLMPILNKLTSHVQVTATASRKDMNVMLVLDRSLSMVNGNAIQPMKDAATWFVNNFAGGRDQVGLLTFGGTAYLAYHPNVNFKSGSNNVLTMISKVTGGGSTNISQAMWLAYQELVALNQPGALNAIVLFTDGRPNAFTGNFQPTTASSCYVKSSKLGFLTAPSTVSGIFKATSTSITDVSENTLADNSSGCAYYADQKKVYVDFAGMPSQDYYGNSTNNGYKIVNLSQMQAGAQVEAAATNAADSAASRIRANTSLDPVILTVGLGGTSSAPPDPDFMKRISNDPSSPSYDNSQAAGLYVWSPTTTQLQAAFMRIASEMLRLSQ